jgi:hypothetical protein
LEATAASVVVKLLIVAAVTSTTASRSTTATSAHILATSAASEATIASLVATTLIVAALVVVSLAITTGEILIAVAVSSPTTRASTRLIILCKLRQLKTFLNFEIETLALLLIQVIKDVNKSLILVIIDVKNSATGTFDSLYHTD